jgi:hypothetical protein
LFFFSQPKADVDKIIGNRRRVEVFKVKDFEFIIILPIHTSFGCSPEITILFQCSCVKPMLAKVLFRHCYLPVVVICGLCFYDKEKPDATPKMIISAAKAQQETAENGLKKRFPSMKFQSKVLILLRPKVLCMYYFG